MADTTTKSKNEAKPKDIFGGGANRMGEVGQGVQRQGHDRKTNRRERQAAQPQQGFDIGAMAKQLLNMTQGARHRTVGGDLVDPNAPTGLDWLAANGPDRFNMPVHSWDQPKSTPEYNPFAPQVRQGSPITTINAGSDHDMVMAGQHGIGTNVPRNMAGLHPEARGLDPRVGHGMLQNEQNDLDRWLMQQFNNTVGERSTPGMPVHEVPHALPVEETSNWMPQPVLDTATPQFAMPPTPTYSPFNVATGEGLDMEARKQLAIQQALGSLQHNPAVASMPAHKPTPQEYSLQQRGGKPLPGHQPSTMSFDNNTFNPNGDWQNSIPDFDLKKEHVLSGDNPGVIPYLGRAGAITGAEIWDIIANLMGRSGSNNMRTTNDTMNWLMRDRQDKQYADTHRLTPPPAWKANSPLYQQNGMPSMPQPPVSQPSNISRQRPYAGGL